MGISVPDSSLLTASTSLFPVNFRMHSARMQLQLDTRPQQETVEEFARTALAELELLAVAVSEGTAKRQRVASLGDNPPTGKGSGKQETAAKGTEEKAGQGLQIW